MTLPLSIIAAHFIADWTAQTNWMALNKSKSNEALVSHVLVYSLLMGAFIAGITSTSFVLWIPILGIPHFIVDYCTSRLGAKLWYINLIPRKPTDYPPYSATVDMGKRYWFWQVIGFDQLLHYCCLAYALSYFGR